MPVARKCNSNGINSDRVVQNLNLTQQEKPNRAQALWVETSWRFPIFWM